MNIFWILIIGMANTAGSLFQAELEGPVEIDDSTGAGKRERSDDTEPSEYDPDEENQEKDVRCPYKTLSRHYLRKEVKRRGMVWPSGSNSNWRARAMLRADDLANAPHHESLTKLKVAKILDNPVDINEKPAPRVRVRQPTSSKRSIPRPKRSPLDDPSPPPPPLPVPPLMSAPNFLSDKEKNLPPIVRSPAAEITGTKQYSATIAESKNLRHAIGGWNNRDLVIGVHFDDQGNSLVLYNETEYVKALGSVIVRGPLWTSLPWIPLDINALLA